MGHSRDAADGQGVQDRLADHHGGSSQGQDLQDVGSPPDAAIHQHRHASGGFPGHQRQDVDRRRQGVERPPGMAAASILPQGTLKIVPGAPHGLCTTPKDLVNEELLAFLEA